MTTQPTNTNTTTRIIAGHAFALVPGRRYCASRPFAERGRARFDVQIRDITDGDHFGPVVAEVPGLSYDAANALLAAFNDGETSFAGRVWDAALPGA